MANNNDIGQELLRIKTRLEKEKNAKLELQGELKNVMKQLKDDFGVSSLEEAKKVQECLEKEIEIAEEQIKTLLERIRRKMEGDEETEDPGNDE